MLNRRLQVLLDDDRHERLERLAAARGVPVAAVVREALDRMLGPVQEQRGAAGRRLLSAPTMPVDDWAVMKRDLDDLNESR